MKRHIISFADSKYARTKDRFFLEAVESCFFDVIKIFNENDLSESIQNYCIKNDRGYGFWIWKSIVINEYLKDIDVGDIVVYCDIGCIINKSGLSRYNEYLDILKTKDMIVFKTPHLERQYTKMDTFNFLNAHEFRNDGQIAATAFLIKKTHHTLSLINQWFDCCTNQTHLLDDSNSSVENSEDFIDNRHDQSIFSLICKKSNVFCLGNEIWMAQNEMGTIFDNKYPFHGARLKY